MVGIYNQESIGFVPFLTWTEPKQTGPSCTSSRPSKVNAHGHDYPLFYTYLNIVVFVNKSYSCKIKKDERRKRNEKKRKKKEEVKNKGIYD